MGRASEGLENSIRPEKASFRPVIVREQGVLGGQHGEKKAALCGLL